jgi:hypothetical protein
MLGEHSGTNVLCTYESQNTHMFGQCSHVNNSWPHTYATYARPCENGLELICNKMKTI